MSIFAQEDVRTIWFLTTMSGSHTIYKKISKNSVMNVSISKVCEYVKSDENSSIEERDALMTSGTNLRINSTLMHGVSLVYKLQMNYYLNDLTALLTQLKSSNMSSQVFGNGTYGDGVRGLDVSKPLSLLSDDLGFSLDDFIGEFDFEDELEIGRRAHEPFANESVNEMYGVVGENGVLEVDYDDSMLNFDVEVTEFDFSSYNRSSTPLDDRFDFDLSLDLSSNGASTPLVERQGVIPETSVVSETGAVPETSVPETSVPVTPKRKRKHALIDDDPIQLSTDVFEEFEQNYATIMQLEMIKRQNVKPLPISSTPSSPPASSSAPHSPWPSTPETGRRLMDIQASYSEPEEFDWGNRTESDNLEVSFPAEGSGPEMTIATTRFWNYLQNMPEDVFTTDEGFQKVNFQDICPLSCDKSLAAKSFCSILELSTRGMVKVETSGGTLGKYTDLEVVLMV